MWAGNVVYTYTLAKLYSILSPSFVSSLRYNLECLYSEASGRGAKRKAAEEAAGSDTPIPKPATVTSEVAQLILER